MGLLDLTPYTNIKSWQKLSEEIGATYIPPHVGQPPRIVYGYKNWQFEFDKYKRFGRSPIQYTRLRAVVKSSADIQFKLSDSLSNSIWTIVVDKKKQYSYNGFNVTGNNDSGLKSLLSIDELDSFLRVRTEVELYLNKTGICDAGADEYCLCLNRLGEWKDITELKIWIHMMKLAVDQLSTTGLIDAEKPVGSLT